MNQHTGRAQLTDMNAEAVQWQNAVANQAAEAMGDEPPMRGPVLVSATFRFARPKKHYRTGKHSDELREDAPRWHAQAPDIDKIIRTLLDGMTGVVFVDDGQVQLGECGKLWGPSAYSRVQVTELPNQQAEE
jgi:Holliday junction resolvase RusA-like endonuclease